MNLLRKHFKPDKLSSLLFYFSILVFIIAFNFSDNGNGGWTLQQLPFLNDRPIRDMIFVDSLVGYAITGDNTVGDTNYIIKTSNSGYNWIILNSIYRDLTKIKFINQNTGFVCGGYNGTSGIVIKTTNGGFNWFSLNTNFANHFSDMSVLNEDTIWVTDDNGLNGGIYRTNNGGINWFNQFYAFGGNPERIYMYNSQTGFMDRGDVLWKTINGGNNWAIIPGQNGFYDIFFVDTQTGWKCKDSVRKTTDGGFTWQIQYIPRGGSTSIYGSLYNFSNINRDTIWGSGGYLEYSVNKFRGLLYFTSNGGNNWNYQIPDTSFGIPGFDFINFINKNLGWADPSIYNKGIHTTNGGDTIFYTSVTGFNTNYITSFSLFQNYPNPFNPRTKINYTLRNRNQVILKVYSITGKLITTLVNKKQAEGEYEVEFDGSEQSSGVYFYSMFLDGDLVETKKMILIR